MTKLTWNDSYSTGLTELDEDHGELLHIINDFNAARDEGRGHEVLGDTLNTVRDYAENHFRHEEKLMAEYNYPGLPEHSSIHSQSMEIIEVFVRQFQDNDPSVTVEKVSHFLRFWFANHFIGEDSKFKRYLFEQGVGDTSTEQSGLFDRLVGRMRLRSRIILAVVIPVIALVGASASQITERLETMETMNALGTISTAAPDISNLVHELQKERGTSAGFIGSKGTKFQSTLADQRKLTDVKLKVFTETATRLAKSETGQTLSGQIAAARKAVSMLSEKRAAVSGLGMTVPQMAGYYTPTIAKLLSIVEAMGPISTDAEVTAAITSYTSFLQGKERAGIERAMGAGGFSAGAFKPVIYNKFVSLIAQQVTYLSVFKNHAHEAEVAALATLMKSPEVAEVARLRKIAIASPQTKDMQGTAGLYWFKSITKKINLLKGLEDTVAGNLQSMTQEHAAEARNELIAITGVMGALLVLTIILATLIVRSITVPLMAATTKAVEIADGDLETPVPGTLRKDEIGQLARAVQHFKDNALRILALTDEQESSRVIAQHDQVQAMHAMADDFQGSVGQVVQSVTAASTEMQASAEALSKTAEQTSSQSGIVAHAAEGASSNVQTVASAAEELSASISEISRQVAESSNAAQSAATDAVSANEQVQGLSDAADRIGEVVGLISDIAEQTNLLALNATIEAARAGDAGKGFAVVANEVKALANQTAKATEDIGAQVTAIQSETGSAVKAIEGISKSIAGISEVSTSVASAMEEQEAATREIARNVEQASGGTTEVTTNINSVREAANETGSAATDMLSAANELSLQAETLHGEVDTFLAAIKAT